VRCGYTGANRIIRFIRFQLRVAAVIIVRTSAWWSHTMPAEQFPNYSPFTDKIVSLPEAAHLAGVSPDTLRRCHKRQELKIIKISPRRVGVRLSDLRAFIDARAA
jgi:hypothetical protein